MGADEVPVHPWTLAWWGTLPHAYRDADAAQDPPYPLLRWMDGIGRIAGQMRELSDSLWAGDLTDVEKAPDAAVRWLAQMLGIDETQRARSTADLRNYLADLTLTGRPAVGTRAAIAEVARRYLTGDRQVGVMPSATTPHTIVLLVRATEVPNGGDLAAFAATIKAAGVVPAGHNLIAVNAVPTWDEWQAAAGATWDELEAKVRVWNDSDALGVNIS
ncbi:minor tail protein [Arthrobacter phage Abba]|uniref:Minor tail protein n=1 Tax=Arthrobacter phage Abba TaxID=2713256 RepID=A0A6G8R2G8_9CAUD|nr:tail protein [Arthrobacter phage Abba]QIN94361.1 minor tail protein [Arthrobacter phage Abba]